VAAINIRLILVGTDGVGAVPLKVSEMIKVVEVDGWYLDCVTGSHRQFRHAAKPGTITIAGKPSDTLPPGTEKSILKQAGIERRQR